MEGNPFEPEEWMVSLKLAVEAGRYRTEAAVDQQERFPWQGKTCADCAFWLDTVWCQVRAMEHPAENHTCPYFDSANHPAAQRIIEDRLQASRLRFWDWLAGHS